MNGKGFDYRVSKVFTVAGTTLILSAVEERRSKRITTVIGASILLPRLPAPSATSARLTAYSPALGGIRMPLQATPNRGDLGVRWATTQLHALRDYEPVG